MQDNKTARKSKNSPQVSLNVRKFLWLRNNFAYCLALSALIWFAGIAYYIQNFIGWESVLAVQPTEFAVLLLAASLPLLLLWFLLAYIERSSSLDANAELFHNYIDGLLYPDAETSKQAKALAKTLLEQTQKLQQENKSVVEQSLNLKKDLDERLGESARIFAGDAAVCVDRRYPHRRRLCAGAPRVGARLPLRRLDERVLLRALAGGGARLRSRPRRGRLRGVPPLRVRKHREETPRGVHQRRRQYDNQGFPRLRRTPSRRRARSRIRGRCSPFRRT